MNKQSTFFNQILLCTLLLFAGCTSKDDVELNIFTVSFETNGGTEILAQEIIKGDKVKEPINPELAGHEFLHWTKDNEKYDFEVEVESDFTLTAQWEKIKVTYSVSFDFDNGNEMTQVIVEEAQNVTSPETPTKEGFVFDGWYLEDQLFDFESIITQDLVLKAKWVSLYETVNLNDGTLTTTNSFWWGKGGNYFETFNELDCYDEKIIDGKVKISNLNFLDMMTIVGFGLSNYDASSVDPDNYPANQLDVQYAAYPAPVKDGEQYIVMYKAPKSFGPTWNPDSLAFVEPVQVNTISFTNNAYGYLSMTKGDYIAKKFEEGDWFKIIVKGWDVNGQETGTIEVFLAEGEEILDTWKKVDLSSLGVVQKLTFDMASSDPADRPQGDFKTPMYFCMKDISLFKNLSTEVE